MNLGPICCPKHTHSREEVIVKFLVCDVVLVCCSSLLLFIIGCGRFSVGFQPKLFADISPLKVKIFVLFFLCVRMKGVALHCIKNG